MWSSASSDLNPINFLEWSMLKAKVSCVSHTSVHVLKTSLLREWAKIPQETMSASVGNFRKIIKAIGGGKYFFF